MRDATTRPLTARRLLLVALIVLATIGCDQATKGIARARLPGKGTVLVVGNVFVLHYVENEGAFLSLGVELPRPLRTLAFIAFPLVSLAIMVVYILRSRNREWMALAALSFIVGGGMGNLIDRLFREGRVSDFMNLGIGRLRIGIFNVADVCILAGCVLLLASPGIFTRRPGARS
jgi:signal peptidase II